MEDYLKRELRQIYFSNLRLVSEMKISQVEQAALRWIAKQSSGVTAAQTADKYKVSVNNVSTRLKSLYDKGYLIRRELKSSSGGIEFVYWIAEELT